MGKSTFKKGQYYAAKYDGINGDLLLGQIKSVRSDGEILLTNLLTGNLSTKKAEVLAQRNKRIKKKQADEMLALWEKTRSKKQVRDFALDAEPFDGYKKQAKVEEPKLDIMGMLDITPVLPGIQLAPMPVLERIANALEQIAKYMGNMRLG